MEKHDTLLISCGTAESRSNIAAILEGHYNFLEAATIQQTNLLLEQNLECLAAVVLDLSSDMAPEEETVEFLEREAEIGRLPVIVLIPINDLQWLEKAFRCGATDVIPADFEPFAILKRIENIVQLHLHRKHLEVLVEEQTSRLRHSNDAMVDALSSIIEHRSVESGQHILRIRHFTKILLEEVSLCCPEYDLTQEKIGIISSAAALHDVGKISIPDAILLKPGKLTEEEMALMRNHTVTGCNILGSLGDLGNPEYMRYAHNICHYHHERWDGRGYPEGLAGEDIPICAQVVGLADVYDALTTKRVYKDAFSFETAVNMILNGECGAFSPKLLECFKHVTRQYEALARDYADGLEPKEEVFDVALPAVPEQRERDGMERTRAKYYALVHYANAFLMELDLDKRIFHLIYNPYPDMVSFQDVNTLPELERKILTELVVPEQVEQMWQFITTELSRFIENGLRRANYEFRFRSPLSSEGIPFEITLMRINPASKTRTLAVLCRKKAFSASGEEVPGHEAENGDRMLPECTFCCRYDEKLTLVRIGAQIHSLAGYGRGELWKEFAENMIGLVHPEDREGMLEDLHRQLRDSTQARLEYRLVHKNGSILWVQDVVRLVAGTDGREYLCSNLTDITHTKREETRLREQLSRYEIILAQTENVLFEWNIKKDTISFSNTWEKIFGFKPVDSHVRATFKEGSYFHPDDVSMIVDGIRRLYNGSDYEMVEVRTITARGRYLWCRFRASALRDEKGALRKIVGIIINIDAEKQAERALQDKAERDSLTRLLNKDAGRRQAEAYITGLDGKANCALLIIDLDDFKQVNDRFGHLFGDAVLTKAAKEIKKLFRNQDIIARIGGDEFMVLMRGTSDKALIQSRCARLITIFRNVFRDQNYNLPLSCSIGVALAPEHGSSYTELFHRADEALYRAKNLGKNNFTFYDPRTAALEWAKQAVTAVNNHIDSDEQPGLADSSLVRHAFQRLYTATDVAASVNDILALVGRQTNVSRVYIFENSPDNKYCSNTYEWCNEGIAPEIDNLQNISYETDIPDYEDNFNEQGIFYCPDITELPKKTYDIVAPQGIKSMLHCAIRENGVFRGYIGFDECNQKRYWTKEQIQVLTFFSEMLSVFLLKKQKQDLAVRQAEELKGILDNQTAWIYIIDPDTCQLKYLNAKTRELAADARPGMCCYHALMGQDHRCENCPSADIRKQGNCTVVMHNGKFDLDVFAEATLIQWEGTQSCLLTCRKIPANLSQLQNQQEKE